MYETLLRERSFDYNIFINVYTYVCVCVCVKIYAFVCVIPGASVGVNDKNTLATGYIVGYVC